MLEKKKTKWRKYGINQTIKLWVDNFNFDADIRMLRFRTGAES